MPRVPPLDASSLCFAFMSQLITVVSMKAAALRSTTASVQRCQRPMVACSRRAAVDYPCSPSSAISQAPSASCGLTATEPAAALQARPSCPSSWHGDGSASHAVLNSTTTAPQRSVCRRRGGWEPTSRDTDRMTGSNAAGCLGLRRERTTRTPGTQSPRALRRNSPPRPRRALNIQTAFRRMRVRHPAA